MLTQEHVTDAPAVWLNCDQAADRIGMSARSLERYRLVGGGPKYAKAGRQVRYRADWLDGWLEGRAFTSTSESRRAGVR